MIEIAPILLPRPDFPPLFEEAVAGDGPFLARLEREWLEGSHRFDRHGELLLGGFREGLLIALGGIDQDRYEPQPGLGRLRHVYVRQEVRRTGAGRAVAEALLGHGKKYFTSIRLRTQNPAAAHLYERLGFVRSSGEFETHRFTVAG